VTSSFSEAPFSMELVVHFFGAKFTPRVDTVVWVPAAVVLGTDLQFLDSVLFF